MEEKSRDAKRTYETLCKALDGMSWSYKREDDDLVVETSAVGDDLEIALRIVVSSEKGVMYVKSVLPFRIPQDKISIVGDALHIANYSMLNGCFEYDMDDGYIAFKIIVPFMGSLISEEVCRYMIILTCQMVDKFNDKIKSLVDGRLTLKEFKTFAE